MSWARERGHHSARPPCHVLGRLQSLGTQRSGVLGTRRWRDLIGVRPCGVAACGSERCEGNEGARALRAWAGGSVGSAAAGTPLACSLGRSSLVLRRMDGVSGGVHWLGQGGPRTRCGAPWRAAAAALVRRGRCRAAAVVTVPSVDDASPASGCESSAGLDVDEDGSLPSAPGARCTRKPGTWADVAWTVGRGPLPGSAGSNPGPVRRAFQCGQVLRAIAARSGAIWSATTGETPHEVDP